MLSRADLNKPLGKYKAKLQRQDLLPSFSSESTKRIERQGAQ